MAKRTKWLHVRLTEQEFKQIQNESGKSTCRGISEYVRSKITGKLVTIAYRNRSLDDLTAHVILIKSELSMIGNNYNQVVRKLHSFDGNTDVRDWLHIHETSLQGMLRKIDENKLEFIQIFERWLQSSNAVQALREP